MDVMRHLLQPPGTHRYCGGGVRAVSVWEPGIVCLGATRDTHRQCGGFTPPLRRIQGWLSKGQGLWCQCWRRQADSVTRCLSVLAQTAQGLAFARSEAQSLPTGTTLPKPLHVKAVVLLACLLRMPACLPSKLLPTPAGMLGRCDSVVAIVRSVVSISKAAADSSFMLFQSGSGKRCQASCCTVVCRSACCHWHAAVPCCAVPCATPTSQAGGCCFILG